MEADSRLHDFPESQQNKNFFYMFFPIISSIYIIMDPEQPHEDNSS